MSAKSQARLLWIYFSKRRVWLFAQTQQGARASANLYSLASCARVNGLEPYAYWRYLFEELPKEITVEALETLLPWNVKRFCAPLRDALSLPNDILVGHIVEY